jgi:hypothetical protein
MADKYKAWVGRLKRVYGITPDEYNAILSAQNEACAICKRHFSEFNYRLCVDHDHSSLRIRGLLCVYCNRRIVGRHRDGDLLRRLATYVEGGTDHYVPKKKRKKRRK